MPRDPQGLYEYQGKTYGPHMPVGRRVADLDRLSPLASDRVRAAVTEAAAPAPAGGKKPTRKRGATKGATPKRAPVKRAAKRTPRKRAD